MDTRYGPKVIDLARFGLFVACLAWVVTGDAEEPRGRALLEAFLDGFSTFQADFEQRSLDEIGELIERSTGTTAIARPGRFRWSYEQPYVQLIVTDGESLWLYDEDLEQVTVSPVEASSGSPADLLVGAIDLDARYRLEELGTVDDVTWVRLIAKAPGDAYQSVELGFAGEDLSGMRLHDNLGQQTIIEFTNQQRNPALDLALFHFEPPPGVDIVNAAAE
jgi:outer membrane lipoprotein carrier protein